MLQEFYVNVTRKIPSPLSPAEAREILGNYGVWQVETIDAGDVVAASEIEERYQLSFWDALIVRAAWKGGAVVIMTENLSPGTAIEGILIQSLFEQPD